LVKEPGGKMSDLLHKVYTIANSKGFFILILSLVVAIYGTKSDRYFGWTNSEAKDAEPIVSDGSGYYAYLPQWFIYPTNNFEFLDSIKKKYPDSHFADYRGDSKGKECFNKYYSGTAVCLTPFFLIGHAHAKIAGFDEDGYSWPYLMWVNLGGIAFFLLGCIGFYLFFRSLEIDRIWILIGILGIAFGTNLSYYTNVFIPFAHVFSFASVSWMFYFAKNWIDTSSKKALLTFSFFIGLSFILRPTNSLSLIFVFFLFQTNRDFWNRIKDLLVNRKIVFGLGLFFTSIPLVFQIYTTYSQTGGWHLNPYVAEGFDNWRDPQIWNVLFSFGKGLFIYTPFFLLCIPGFYFLAKKNLRLFIGLTIFSIIFVYIAASWWCWWYGGGLGARHFIDVLIIWMVPVLFGLQYSGKIIKASFVVFIAITIYIYQIYEFQMKNNILSHNLISKEQFLSVFLQTDERFKWGLERKMAILPDNKKRLSIDTQFQSYDGVYRFGKSFVFAPENPYDNPYVAIGKTQLSAYPKDAFFGAVMYFELQISDPTSNPCLLIFYFKDQQVIKKEGPFMGPDIHKLNRWNKVYYVLNSDIQFKDFDSVRIHFEESTMFPVSGKNFKVEYYSFD
jgi:hypothetical protein